GGFDGGLGNGQGVGAAVDLVGGGVLEVVGAAVAGSAGPLVQGVGAGGDGLSAVGLQRPGAVQLLGDDAGDVGLQRHEVDDLEGGAGEHAQAAGEARAFDFQHRLGLGGQAGVGGLEVGVAPGGDVERLADGVG